MREDKRITEEYDQWESWNQATYRTGSTRPPKSRGGIIAFLLALVIFLSGISTALGLMNIRLFRALSSLEATDPAPISFSQGEDFSAPESAVEYPLGFAGQEVSAFWQTYHGLPAGIYIVEVSDDLLFQKHGPLPGDIMTKFNGVVLQDAATFEALLEKCHPGDLVQVVIYRSGSEYEMTLEIQED